MNNELENADYDDMDDLALPDHIDYSDNEPDGFCMDALDTVYGY